MDVLVSNRNEFHHRVWVGIQNDSKFQILNFDICEMKKSTERIEASSPSDGKPEFRCNRDGKSLILTIKIPLHSSEEYDEEEASGGQGSNNEAAASTSSLTGRSKSTPPKLPNSPSNSQQPGSPANGKKKRSSSDPGDCRLESLLCSNPDILPSLIAAVTGEAQRRGGIGSCGSPLPFTKAYICLPFSANRFQSQNQENCVPQQSDPPRPEHSSSFQFIPEPDTEPEPETEPEPPPEPKEEPPDTPPECPPPEDKEEEFIQEKEIEEVQPPLDPNECKCKDEDGGCHCSPSEPEITPPEPEITPPLDPNECKCENEDGGCHCSPSEPEITLPEPEITPPEPVKDECGCSPECPCGEDEPEQLKEDPDPEDDCIVDEDDVPEKVVVEPETDCPCGPGCECGPDESPPPEKVLVEQATGTEPWEPKPLRYPPTPSKARLVQPKRADGFTQTLQEVPQLVERDLPCPEKENPLCDNPLPPRPPPCQNPNPRDVPRVSQEDPLCPRPRRPCPRPAHPHRQPQQQPSSFLGPVGAHAQRLDRTCGQNQQLHQLRQEIQGAVRPGGNCPASLHQCTQVIVLAPPKRRCFRGGHHHRREPTAQAPPQCPGPSFRGPTPPNASPCWTDPNCKPK